MQVTSFLYPPSPSFLLLDLGSGDLKPFRVVEITASRVALLEQVGTKRKVMLSDPLLVVYWVTGRLFKAQGPRGESQEGRGLSQPLLGYVALVSKDGILVTASARWCGGFQGQALLLISIVDIPAGEVAEPKERHFFNACC